MLAHRWLIIGAQAAVRTDGFIVRAGILLNPASRPRDTTPANSSPKHKADATMFYGLPKERSEAFSQAMRTLQESYPIHFAADMLITFDRNMGFYKDAAFMAAFNAETMRDQEVSLIWRLHVLCWCARTALRREGDFVECGVFRGFSSAVAARYLDFAKVKKNWFLYDTFAGIPENQLAPGVQNPGVFKEQNLYQDCVNRFAPYPNVRVVRGAVPDVLAQGAPDKVAFLHLDMNSADAEDGALRFFYERLTPGAMVLFDDYGWRAYREQKLVADEFMEEVGGQIMEMPTGQGLYIR